MIFKNNIKSKRGFTLIEIIVSLAIFAVVAVVAAGSFLKVIDANKKAQTIKTAVNNLNFILESMSREIRMGSNYYCSINYSGSSDAVLTAKGDSYCISDQSSVKEANLIVFKTQKIGIDAFGNSCHLYNAFWFDSASSIIKKAEQQSFCTESLSSSDFYPVTSSSGNLSIKNAIFSVFNNKFTSGQPLVRINISATAGKKEKNKTDVSVQTHISQFLMNNYDTETN